MNATATRPAHTAFPTVSVIVPVRNEARNLEIVLPALAAIRPAVHEIIVVDGNSTDDSIDTARRAAARATPWPAGSPPPPARSS